MSHAAYRLKGVVRQLPCTVRDAVRNRRFVRGNRRVLVVRHAGRRPNAGADFLDWLQRRFPDVRARFELSLLPCRLRDWSPYVLCAAWLPDPVGQWSPKAYAQARELEETCRREGISVINPVACASRSVKSVRAKFLKAAGIRTPRAIPIENAEHFRSTIAALGLPLIICEDGGHGQPRTLLRSLADIARVDFRRYRRPVAVQFINVCQPRDRLFRSYRYLAAGEIGVAQRLVASTWWEAQPAARIVTPQIRQEEAAYLAAPDPNHHRLQRARQALGLDVVAFDYSYDRAGRMVVWDANPLVDVTYPRRPALRYTLPAVERSFAALAKTYLTGAGLEVPAGIGGILASQEPISSEGVQTQEMPYRRAA